jgi:hypothetical protein
MMSRILSAAALVAGLSLPSIAEEKEPIKLWVRAISYRAIPHEAKSPSSAVSSSNSTCYGSGSASGYWATMNLKCQTVVTPPPAPPKTVKSLEILNIVDAHEMMYTITCEAKWAGTDCTWLNPGENFPAELKNKTMWVAVRRGRNLGRRERAKYRILDVRPKE